MDRPFTLKHALILLICAGILTIVTFGYAWTSLEAQHASLEYRVNSLRATLEKVAECNQTGVEADLNQDRIRDLESKVTEWNKLADVCAKALKEAQQTDPASDPTRR